MNGWTGEDAMIVAGSRLLADGTVVFAGVGAPLVASVLAQRLHAPDLTIVLEGGFIGPRMLPGSLPISTNEMRGAHGSVMLAGIVDVFLLAQRGLFDVGFVGAAQIDPFGNLNTSLIGDPSAPKVRLPGSGGANDIVSSCREIFVITKHERRRFVPRVDFVTSPGYLGGGDERERAGLLASRPSKVITDLAVLGFEPDTHRLRIEAVQVGVRIEEVIENTGFDLPVADHVDEVPPPTAEEIETLAYLTGAQVEPVVAGAEVGTA